LKRKRSNGRIYSVGQLNALIDSALHPLARRDGRFYVVDGILHGLVERNPPASIRKFIKYNLPPVLSQLGGTDPEIVSAGDRMLKDMIRLARRLQRASRPRRTVNKRRSQAR